MKRNIYVALIALVFLFAGLQTAFSQEAVSPDRGRGVTVDALPGELKALDIKDYHIVSEERPAGIIQTLVGHVVVRIGGNTDRAYFAGAGDQIFEKDTIFTLKRARCRVKFNTDDIVTMGQNSRIGVDEIIDDRKRKKKKSVISMLRGRAMFYVMRLFRYKTAQTLIKTPTAICGVRGTKFGVEVRKTDKKLAQAGPVYIADASDSGVKYFMAAAGTNDTTTIVYGFEGEVEVTSPVDGSTQTVGEGQNLELTGEGAGDVEPTPPGVGEQFASDTEAPGPEGEEDTGDGGGDTGDDGGDAGDDTGGTADTDAAGNAAETQTAQNIDDEGAGLGDDTGGGDSGRHFGYFSNMVSNVHSSPYLEEIFVSPYLQDFSSKSIKGNALIDPNGYAEAGGTVSCMVDPYLKRVYLYENENTYGEDYPVTWTETGSNEYQSWGYWTMTRTFRINEAMCEIDSRGYYIHGDTTPSDVASGIHGTFTGAARGTYYGGYDMSGTFSCYVNAGSGSISSFTLDVINASAQREAHISNGSGTFGNGVFNLVTGNFSLKNAEDSYTPGKKACNGALYGPNGEYIGGAWGMYKDSVNGAAGIFQGAKH